MASASSDVLNTRRWHTLTAGPPLVSPARLAKQQPAASPPRQRPSMSVQRQAAELAATIEAALTGDAGALDRLEASSSDTMVAATALGLLQAAPTTPAEIRGAQFAAVMVMRHARSGDSGQAELWALCQQCLRLGLHPIAGTRPAVHTHCVTAAAAAAARVSAEAIAAVHAEALAVLAAGQQSGEQEAAIAGLKALMLLAEECARKQVAEAARPAIQALAQQTLSTLASVVGSGLQGKTTTAALRTLQQWIICGHIKVEDARRVPDLLHVLCETFATDDSTVADAVTEAVAEFLPFVQNASMGSPALPGLLQLAAALSKQRERLDLSAERIHYEVARALTRLAAGLAGADVAWADDGAMVAPTTAGLLAFLSEAASCPDRSCSALAIEGLTGLQRARNRLQAAGSENWAGLLPAQAEYALLPALLAHARFPAEADEDLDDEEWARVREEVIGMACLQSYCVLRLLFVRHCCEALQTAMAAGDWRAVESTLFGLANIAGALECRLQLANPQLADEQRECTELLTQILSSCCTLDVAGMSAAIGSRDDVDEDEAATAAAAMHAAVARMVGGYASWLASSAATKDKDMFISVADSALAGLLSLPGWQTHCDIENSEHEASLAYALAEHLKQSATAVEQLCRHGRVPLARSCISEDGQASQRMVQLAATGARYGGPTVEVVAFSVCWMSLHLQSAVRLEFAGAVFGPLTSRLQEIAGAGSGALEAKNVAAEAAAVLKHMGAALQGLAMGDEGLAAARGCMSSAAGPLQAVASACATAELSDAMSALLCGAVGVVNNGDDEAMLEFICTATSALGGHHPAAAASVASQLAQTWGRAAIAKQCVASLAISKLGCGLQACIGSGELDDVIGGFKAAAVYLERCSGLLVASGGTLEALGAALGAYSRRSEPSVCSAVLACVRGFEAAANGGNAATTGALGPNVAALAGGLAMQLCGRCPAEAAPMAARSLHWVVSLSAEQQGGVERETTAAVIEGFSAGGMRDIGDGSALRAALQQPREAWTKQAEVLWHQMR